MLVLMAAYAAVMGAALASFGCVVSERVPAGQSIQGRSHCACGRQLRVSENVPVLGWLRARRGAACCGTRPPVRYVLAEAGAGLWGAAAGAAGWHLFEAGYSTAAVVGPVVALLLGTAAVVAATWQRPSA